MMGCEKGWMNVGEEKQMPTVSHPSFESCRLLTLKKAIDLPRGERLQIVT